jgi:hypothetical protein
VYYSALAGAASKRHVGLRGFYLVLHNVSPKVENLDLAPRPKGANDFADALSKRPVPRAGQVRQVVVEISAGLELHCGEFGGFHDV